MSYLYSDNRGDDSFVQIQIQLDSGDSGILRMGFYYDLSVTEAARASKYIVLEQGVTPANATPVGISRIPVTGTPNQDDVPYWDTEAASFIPRPPTTAAGSGTDAEVVRDTMASALVAGTNVTITPNDAANTITISATGGSTDPEVVRDTIAAALVAGTNVTITPNDAANTITIAAAGGGTTDPEVVRDTIAAALTPGTGISITPNDAANTITVATTGGGTVGPAGPQGPAGPPGPAGSGATPASFSTVPLNNGWNDYGAPYAPLRYAVYQGFVHLNGVVISSGTGALVLPESMWPDARQALLVHTGSGDEQWDVTESGAICLPDNTSLAREFLEFHHVWPASTTPTPEPTPSTAAEYADWSANQFIASIGFNVHTYYDYTVYNSGYGAEQGGGYQRFGRLLGAIGGNASHLLNVRDGHHTDRVNGGPGWGQPISDALNHLWDTYGIRSILIEDYRSAGTQAQRIAQIYAGKRDEYLVNAYQTANGVPMPLEQRGVGLVRGVRVITAGNETNSSEPYMEFGLWSPTYNGTYVAGVSADAATDTFTLAGHPFAHAQAVAMWSPPAGTGFAQFVLYYIINVTTDTFQITDQWNGLPLNITANISASDPNFLISRLSWPMREASNLNELRNQLAIQGADPGSSAPDADEFAAAALRNMPVHGYSMTNVAAAALYRDALSNLPGGVALEDATDLHPYAGGRWPFEAIPNHVGSYVDTVHGAGTNYPFVVTEQGYHTAEWAIANGHGPVPYDIQAIYGIRMWIDHYYHSVTRGAPPGGPITVWYELIDQGVNRVDYWSLEENFGVSFYKDWNLINEDLVMKALAESLRDMIAIMFSEGATDAGPSITANVTATPSIGSVLFRMADGRHALALYQFSFLWDVDARTRPAVPADISVNVALPGGELPISRYMLHRRLTNLTAATTLGATVANVADTSQFAASGSLKVHNQTGTYTGKTANSFTGCTGFSGLVPIGAAITQGNAQTAVDTATTASYTFALPADDNCILVIG